MLHGGGTHQEPFLITHIYERRVRHSAEGSPLHDGEETLPVSWPSILMRQQCLVPQPQGWEKNQPANQKLHLATLRTHSKVANRK